MIERGRAKGVQRRMREMAAKKENVGSNVIVKYLKAKMKIIYYEWNEKKPTLTEAYVGYTPQAMN